MRALSGEDDALIAAQVLLHAHNPALAAQCSRYSTLLRRSWLPPAKLQTASHDRGELTMRHSAGPFLSSDLSDALERARRQASLNSSISLGSPRQAFSGRFAPLPKSLAPLSDVYRRLPAPMQRGWVDRGGGRGAGWCRGGQGRQDRHYQRTFRTWWSPHRRFIRYGHDSSSRALSRLCSIECQPTDEQ